jgi:hypothetical protein
MIKLNPSFDYQGGFANEIVSLAKGNRLVDMPDNRGGCVYYYWLFSKDILEAFKDVFVLTYLFDAQTMKYYFDITGIEYRAVGITCNGRGEYHFDHVMSYVPEYTQHLSDKIHIFENEKMNAIGNNKNALSFTWFKRAASNAEDRETLKKNVYNYFVNYHRDKPGKTRLWATYEIGKPFIRGKGYFYSDIAFNAKATNNFKDRQVLAYCVNIFMQPNEKQYLSGNGVNVLEDRYALSVMIQWIWRSAIRDGKEIWIYIPSKRMRTLLQNWIEEVEQSYIHIRGEQE